MKGYKIVNVVATGDLNQEVDLIEISRLPNTIYDKQIYSGRAAYFKDAKMVGKVTIFPSGKLISVGTKSLKQAQSEINKTIQFLAAGSLIDPVNVKIMVRNIVALIILENEIDLETFALVSEGIYEPEQFPGLILRDDNPKVTYLIFSSGKIVITGCKSIEEVKEASEKIEKNLSCFR